MNTRILMIASAVFMGLLGIVFSFMPHEMLRYFGADVTGITPYLLQLAGAAWLGFAIMNWMAKAVLIGGIYARPLALGNFLHFVAGALSLIKIAPQQQQLLLWILALLYSAYALGFGVTLFTHPQKAGSK